MEKKPQTHYAEPKKQNTKRITILFSLLRSSYQDTIRCTRDLLRECIGYVL